MIAVNKNQQISDADPISTVLAEPPVPAQISEQVETADGARAIEVAALFDDAVLEVRHLDTPSAGRVTGMTKAILGSAAAALIGTGALFAHSYLEVAAEKRAEETSESRRAHKKESGKTRDGAAGGLLFYGVSALLYGLSRAGRERRENEFSIGTANDATFKIDAQGLPGDRFPLVRSNGTDYEFLFTNSMSGELTVNGKTTSLAELRTSASVQPATGIAGAMSLVIPEGARVSVDHESCSFLIRSVARPRHYPTPLRFDWRAQTYTGAVLLGAASMLGLMFAVPPDPRSLALDSFTNEHIARYLVKAPAPPEPESAEWLKVQPKVIEKSGGQAHKDKSGTIGKETAPKNNNSRFAFKGPKDNPDPQITRQQAREIAANSGILLAMQGSSSALAQVMAKTSALGSDSMDALSHLNGNVTDNAYGDPQAIGLIGSNRGGDGTGDNTIGLGPWGRIGRGPGPGGPGGYHPAAAKLACKDCGNAKPTWTIGQPELKGNYDPSLIRRVVRQHMNEVKFCYEKELTRDASLAGRVVVKFSIGGMGNVMTSVIESSTIKASGTDRCIAEAVRRWEFPKPQGGLVLVSYPFVLKSVSGAE